MGEYVQVINHSHVTRNNKASLRLAEVKIEKEIMFPRIKHF